MKCGADRRYARAADWEYIAECSAIIKQAKKELAMATDFNADNLEYGETQRMAFLGNGDVYSYTDFYNAIDHSGVDTTMIARGAIIKPWIFEEIQQRQHIDKSATERLEMLRQFAHWGLEHWVFYLTILTEYRDPMPLVYPTRGVSFVNS